MLSPGGNALNIALLNFRGLGDEMIMTNMLNVYADQFNASDITIITWSKNEFIFSNLLIKHKLLLVDGPCLNKFSSFLSAFTQVFILTKNNKYDLAVNFSGDF